MSLERFGIEYFRKIKPHGLKLGYAIALSLFGTAFGASPAFALSDAQFEAIFPRNPNIIQAARCNSYYSSLTGVQPSDTIANQGNKIRSAHPFGATRPKFTEAAVAFDINGPVPSQFDSIYYFVQIQKQDAAWAAKCAGNDELHCDSAGNNWVYMNFAGNQTVNGTPISYGNPSSPYKVNVGSGRGITYAGPWGLGGFVSKGYPTGDTKTYISATDIRTWNRWGGMDQKSCNEGIVFPTVKQWDSDGDGLIDLFPLWVFEDGGKYRYRISTVCGGRGKTFQNPPANWGAWDTKSGDCWTNINMTRSPWKYFDGPELKAPSMKINGPFPKVIADGGDVEYEFEFFDESGIWQEHVFMDRPECVDEDNGFFGSLFGECSSSAPKVVNTGAANYVRDPGSTGFFNYKAAFLSYLDLEILGNSNVVCEMGDLYNGNTRLGQKYLHAFQSSLFSSGIPTQAGVTTKVRFKLVNCRGTGYARPVTENYTTYGSATEAEMIQAQLYPQYQNPMIALVSDIFGQMVNNFLINKEGENKTILGVVPVGHTVCPFKVGGAANTYTYDKACGFYGEPPADPAPVLASLTGSTSNITTTTGNTRDFTLTISDDKTLPERLPLDAYGGANSHIVVERFAGPTGNTPNCSRRVSKLSATQRRITLYDCTGSEGQVRLKVLKSGVTDSAGQPAVADIKTANIDIIPPPNYGVLFGQLRINIFDINGARIPETGNIQVIKAPAINCANPADCVSISSFRDSHTFNLAAGGWKVFVTGFSGYKIYDGNQCPVTVNLEATSTLDIRLQRTGIGSITQSCLAPYKITTIPNATPDKPGTSIAFFTMYYPANSHLPPYIDPLDGKIFDGTSTNITIPNGQRNDTAAETSCRSTCTGYFCALRCINLHDDPATIGKAYVEGGVSATEIDSTTGARYASMGVQIDYVNSSGPYSFTYQGISSELAVSFTNMELVSITPAQTQVSTGSFTEIQVKFKASSIMDFSNLDAADFEVVKTVGSSNAVISSLGFSSTDATAGTYNYAVNINTGSENGKFKLRLAASNNLNLAPSGPRESVEIQVGVLDPDGPVLANWGRVTPSPTQASSGTIRFIAEFQDKSGMNGSSIDAADFVIETQSGSSLPPASIVSIAPTGFMGVMSDGTIKSPYYFDVNVGTTGSGSVRIKVNAAHNITDIHGNRMVNLLSSPYIEVNRSKPVIGSITIPGSNVPDNINRDQILQYAYSCPARTTSNLNTRTFADFIYNTYTPAADRGDASCAADSINVTGDSTSGQNISMNIRCDGAKGWYRLGILEGICSDDAGNLSDPIVTDRSFLVDNEAPVATIELLSENQSGYFNSASEIEFSVAIEDNSTLNGPETPLSQSLSILPADLGCTNDISNGLVSGKNYTAPITLSNCTGTTDSLIMILPKGFLKDKAGNESNEVRLGDGSGIHIVVDNTTPNPEIAISKAYLNGDETHPLAFDIVPTQPANYDATVNGEFVPDLNDDFKNNSYASYINGADELTVELLITKAGTINLLNEDVSLIDSEGSPVVAEVNVDAVNGESANDSKLYRIRVKGYEFNGPFQIKIAAGVAKNTRSFASPEVNAETLLENMFFVDRTLPAFAGFSDFRVNDDGVEIYWNDLDMSEYVPEKESEQFIYVLSSTEDPIAVIPSILSPSGKIDIQKWKEATPVDEWYSTSAIPVDETGYANGNSFVWNRKKIYPNMADDQVPELFYFLVYSEDAAGNRTMHSEPLRVYTNQLTTVIAATDSQGQPRSDSNEWASLSINWSDPDIRGFDDAVEKVKIYVFPPEDLQQLGAAASAASDSSSGDSSAGGDSGSLAQPLDLLSMRIASTIDSTGVEAEDFRERLRTMSHDELLKLQSEMMANRTTQFATDNTNLIRDIQEKEDDNLIVRCQFDPRLDSDRLPEERNENFRIDRPCYFERALVEGVMNENDAEIPVLETVSGNRRFILPYQLLDQRKKYQFMVRPVIKQSVDLNLAGADLYFGEADTPSEAPMIHNGSAENRLASLRIDPNAGRVYTSFYVQDPQGQTANAEPRENIILLNSSVEIQMVDPQGILNNGQPFESPWTRVVSNELKNEVQTLTGGVPHNVVKPEGRYDFDFPIPALPGPAGQQFSVGDIMNRSGLMQKPIILRVRFRVADSQALSNGERSIASDPVGGAQVSGASVAASGSGAQTLSSNGIQFASSSAFGESIIGNPWSPEINRSLVYADEGGGCLASAFATVSSDRGPRPPQGPGPGVALLAFSLLLSYVFYQRKNITFVRIQASVTAAASIGMVILFSIF